MRWNKRVSPALAVSVVAVLLANVHSAERDAGQRRAEADVVPEVRAEPQAEELVEQALLASLQGDNERRRALLEEAQRMSPELPLARWHSGQVRVNGLWTDIAEVQEQSLKSTLLSQYRKRRAEVEPTAESHLRLARWCLEHALVDEARVHFTKVLEFEPDNALAVKHLELELYDGVWMNKDQIAKHVERIERLAEATKVWKPQLLEIRRELTSTDGEAENSLRAKLQESFEPDAIPALEEVFSRDSRRWGLEAIALLETVPQQAATEALVRYAVLSKPDAVRQSALDALKKRSMEDVVPVLLQGLQAPIESEVELVSDGDSLRLRRKLTQEGAESDRTQIAELRIGLQNPNPFASRIVDHALARTLRDASRNKESLEKANRAAEQLNEKIYEALAELTGANVVPEPRAWWDWWLEYNDLLLAPGRPVYENETVYAYNVPLYVPYSRPYGYSSIPQISPDKPKYDPKPKPRPKPSGGVTRTWGPGPWSGVPRPTVYIFRQSCFAKGTMVWSLLGPKPIEEIKPGDRVLSQDPESGELAYKPVLHTTLRVNRRMLTLNLGSESITSTRGHQYWVPGQGWKIPKDMKTGEMLYGISGMTKVNSVEESAAQDAYNLIVADFNTYFVGQERLLVRDNTPGQPTSRFAPGIDPLPLKPDLAHN